MPIGGPVIGRIGENAGSRWSLLVGGSAARIAAIYGRPMLTRASRRVNRTADPAGELAREAEVSGG